MFNEKAFPAHLLTGCDIPAIAGGGFLRVRRKRGGLAGNPPYDSLIRSIRH